MDTAPRIPFRFMIGFDKRTSDATMRLLRALELNLSKTLIYSNSALDSMRGAFEKTKDHLESIKLPDVRDAVDAFDIKSHLIEEYRYCTQEVNETKAEVQNRIYMISNGSLYSYTEHALTGEVARAQYYQRIISDVYVRFMIVCREIENRTALMKETLKRGRFRTDFDYGYHFTDIVRPPVVPPPGALTPGNFKIITASIKDQLKSYYDEQLDQIKSSISKMAIQPKVAKKLERKFTAILVGKLRRLIKSRTSNLVDQDQLEAHLQKVSDKLDTLVRGTLERIKGIETVIQFHDANLRRLDSHVVPQAGISPADFSRLEKKISDDLSKLTDVGNSNLLSLQQLNNKMLKITLDHSNFVNSSEQIQQAATSLDESLKTIDVRHKKNEKIINDFKQKAIDSINDAYYDVMGRLNKDIGRLASDLGRRYNEASDEVTEKIKIVTDMVDRLASIDVRELVSLFINDFTGRINSILQSRAADENRINKLIGDMNDMNVNLGSNINKIETALGIILDIDDDDGEGDVAGATKASASKVDQRKKIGKLNDFFYKLDDLLNLLKITSKEASDSAESSLIWEHEDQMYQA